MAEILNGRPVADAIDDRNRKEAARLKEKGISPRLALFRIGEQEADLAYERNIKKRSVLVDVDVLTFQFPADVSADLFYERLKEANERNDIHGILVFRPLPKHFPDRLEEILSPEKDVDGCLNSSLAATFIGNGQGFSPCTAQAVIALLDHYGLPIEAQNAVVLGRSLVIGRPVSMLLLQRNATVTICHTKTEKLSEITRKAAILVCATGKLESIGSAFVTPGQIVIDVGIGWNEKRQKLCGDVLFEEVEPIVKAITPVPGGIGAITTSVLCSHVIEAAKKLNRISDTDTDS